MAVQEEDGAGGGGELLRTASEAELLRALAEAHEAQAAAELNGTRRAIRRNSARNSLTPPPSLLSGTNDEERAFSIRDEAVRAVVWAATYVSDPEAEAAADFAVKHRVSCGFPPVPSLADVEADFALPHDFTAPAPPPRGVQVEETRAVRGRRERRRRRRRREQAACGAQAGASAAASAARRDAVAGRFVR